MEPDHGEDPEYDRERREYEFFMENLMEGLDPMAIEEQRLKRIADPKAFEKMNDALCQKSKLIGHIMAYLTEAANLTKRLEEFDDFVIGDELFIGCGEFRAAVTKVKMMDDKDPTACYDDGYPKD